MHDDQAKFAEDTEITVMNQTFRLKQTWKRIIKSMLVLIFFSYKKKKKKKKGHEFLSGFLKGQLGIGSDFLKLKLY